MHLWHNRWGICGDVSLNTEGGPLWKVPKPGEKISYTSHGRRSFTLRNTKNLDSQCKLSWALSLPSFWHPRSPCTGFDLQQKGFPQDPIPIPRFDRSLLRRKWTTNEYYTRPLVALLYTRYNNTSYQFYGRNSVKPAEPLTPQLTIVHTRTSHEHVHDPDNLKNANLLFSSGNLMYNEQLSSISSANHAWMMKVLKMLNIELCVFTSFKHTWRPWSTFS